MRAVVVNCVARRGTVTSSPPSTTRVIVAQQIATWIACSLLAFILPNRASRTTCFDSNAPFYPAPSTLPLHDYTAIFFELWYDLYALRLHAFKLRDASYLTERQRRYAYFWLFSPLQREADRYLNSVPVILCNIIGIYPSSPLYICY